MKSKKLKKLSKEEIEKMIENVEASFAVDGLEVTEDMKELVRKYFEGVYTEEQVLEIIKNKVLNT